MIYYPLKLISPIVSKFSIFHEDLKKIYVTVMPYILDITKGK